MQSTFNTTQIEEFIKQLVDRKAVLEQQQPVSEKLEITLKEKWGPIEKVKVTEFSKQLDEIKQVVKLEIAIGESIKDFVSEQVFEKVKKTLPKVRESNNLLCMNGVFSMYRGDVKTRQVLKLVNAVYRYNRDIIYGYTPDATLKSKIKHATSCPHCGEVSAMILKNMVETKAVLLPV